MTYSDPHISDQDLLLAADGELSANRQEQVRRHLQACWTCRCRMAQLERVVAGVVDSYHSLLNPQVPSGHGSAALLKATLMREPAAPFFRWRWPVWVACALAIASMTAILLWRQTFSRVESGLVPNPNLTPGETVSISQNDVCQSNDLTENAQVPETTRDAVFSAYGMKDAPKNAYEVDFLITPALGGSANVRNLWPQPYHRAAWNAYRKDVLEERLRSLVCSGELDLATAQREIATNWIDAYKKYVDGRHQ
jgi:hypothetical protein